MPADNHITKGRRARPKTPLSSHEDKPLVVRTSLARSKPPLISDDDEPLVVRPSLIKLPRFSKFLDMHAKEGKEGHTASEDSVSEDDRCCSRNTKL